MLPSTSVTVTSPFEEIGHSRNALVEPIFAENTSDVPEHNTEDLQSVVIRYEEPGVETAENELEKMNSGRVATDRIPDALGVFMAGKAFVTTVLRKTQG